LATLADYDAAWPERFAAERAAIVAELGPSALRIEHIGSTAVPRLAAKPIIDILLVLSAVPADPGIVTGLRRLGYRDHGEHGISGRAYFTKGEPRTHHLHAFAVGDPHIERYLRFRDGLRADPVAAERYAALKRGLAASGLTGNAYAEAKSWFVDAVVTRPG